MGELIAKFDYSTLAELFLSGKIMQEILAKFGSNGLAFPLLEAFGSKEQLGKGLNMLCNDHYLSVVLYLHEEVARWDGILDFIYQWLRFTGTIQLNTLQPIETKPHIEVFINKWEIEKT